MPGADQFRLVTGTLLTLLSSLLTYLYLPDRLEKRNRKFVRNFSSFSKARIRPKFRKNFFEIDLRPNLGKNFAKFWPTPIRYTVKRLLPQVFAL